MMILFFRNISLYSKLKNLMNRSIIMIMMLLLFSNIYSQESFLKLPGTKESFPTVIVNGNIISSESFIKENEGLIIKMSITKDEVNRHDHKFYNLTEGGIVFVEMNKKVNAKTQGELNVFFGIAEENKIYVNGYLVEDSNYKVGTDSVIGIEVVMPDATNKLQCKSINVLTSVKNKD